MEHREVFNYGQMAQEVRHEEEVLRKLLRIRRTAGPPSPDQEQTWNYHNRMIYSMCLEQRAKATEFERRARERGQIWSLGIG